MSAAVDATSAADSYSTTDELSSSTSAISHSISQKGKTSYYYAHGANIGLKERPVAYDEPPRLIAVEEKAAGETRLVKRAIDKYAWSDGQKSVKVYVTFEGAGDLPDEALRVTHSDDSFQLEITHNNVINVLKVGPLHSTITGVSVKTKGSNVVVSLTKSVGTTWWELTKSAAGLGADDE